MEGDPRKWDIVPTTAPATGMEDFWPWENTSWESIARGGGDRWVDACDSINIYTLLSAVEGFREWDYEIAVGRVPAVERMEYTPAVYATLDRFGIDKKYYGVFHMHHGPDPLFDEMAASIGLYCDRPEDDGGCP